MNFYIGQCKDSSELNSMYFKEYTDLLYDIFKEEKSIQVHPGDLILYRKGDEVYYKTAYVNEFELSYVKSVIESVRRRENLLFSEYVNMFSVDHLLGITVNHYVFPLQEKINLIPEEKRKYYIADFVDAFPDIVDPEKEPEPVQIRHNKQTNAKFTNRNTILFKLLPMFVKDAELNGLPLELIILKYIKSIKELGV